MSAPAAIARTSDSSAQHGLVVPLPTATGLSQPAAPEGCHPRGRQPQGCFSLLGIKLDLEAEVHLTARVKGDVVVGLY
ncbi:unnamed protein product [Clonostachys byssicola]|uniref:Uncharacterized protein n=1 Tax=Clonostachys byssicola TaxID=160290 RepID=A0A9N9UCT4_9HYPO|nr:unnamed protein product [Clonostachys byssicola]